MIDSSNWLDISSILRNEIFGSTVLFILVMALAIAYFGLLKRMPWQAIIALIVLFGFIVFELYSVTWAIVIILLGIGFYLYSMKKTVETQ